MSRSILITGATGSFGQAMVKRLLGETMSAEDMDKAIAQYAAESEQMKQDLEVVNTASSIGK